jgi:hypothetical protein
MPYRNSSEAASTNVEIKIVGTTPKDEQVIWIRWQEKLEQALSIHRVSPYVPMVHCTSVPVVQNFWILQTSKDCSYVRE